MEIYLTIEELAEHLKLSGQTIRRYVLNREIPYHKIKKVIRFRVSEIEKWIDGGGEKIPEPPVDDRERGLFAELEDEQTGADGNDGEAGEPEEAGADGETCCPPATDSLEEQA
jgi:excisionase family DNA binding protein